MDRRVWQIVAMLGCLVIASAVVSGCASRKGGPAGMAGSSESGGATGGTPGAGGRAGSGPGGSGGLFGGSGPGRDGAGTDGSGAAGGAGLTFAGTTIPALPSPGSFTETAALRDIHFDFDQYRIRPEAGRALEENARWLKDHTGAALLIEGHADERGTNQYNLALAERRASAARDYLIALGVPRTRINVVSYGEERPVCADRTENCWAQNRRAHFLVKP